MRLFFNFYFLILFGVFNSCRVKNMHQANDHIDNGAQGIRKPGSSFMDSLFVLSPAAVFFSPDSLQLNAISKVTDPAVFKSSMHEYFYQMRNARHYFSDHW